MSYLYLHETVVHQLIHLDLMNIYIYIYTYPISHLAQKLILLSHLELWRELRMKRVVQDRNLI